MALPTVFSCTQATFQSQHLHSALMSPKGRNVYIFWFSCSWRINERSYLSMAVDHALSEVRVVAPRMKSLARSDAWSTSNTALWNVNNCKWSAATLVCVHIPLCTSMRGCLKYYKRKRSSKAIILYKWIDLQINLLAGSLVSLVDQNASGQTTAFALLWFHQLVYPT